MAQQRLKPSIKATMRSAVPPQKEETPRAGTRGVRPAEPRGMMGTNFSGPTIPLQRGNANHVARNSTERIRKRIQGALRIKR